MTEIHVHASSPIVFIDTSYYIFHRYFATLRWYSIREFQGMTKEEQNAKVQTLHEDAAFTNAFYKHITQDVKKWQKTWKVPHGNIVFGFDCSRENIWRNEHHDAYKSGRVTASNFNGNIFSLFYRWFDSNKAQYGFVNIEYDRLEADDVISLSLKELFKLQKTSDIVVLTNDNDYLQMRMADGVRLINAQMKDIAERSSVGNAEQDLLIKILMGDPSDNIPSVAPKIGPATAKKLAAEGRDHVENWARTKGYFERYKENERLISFDCIPKDLVDGFRSKYTWVLV